MLEPITRDRRRAGLFLDFDGTLSEIVQAPEEARSLEGTGRLLDSLATRFGLVAIVSGRRARDVVERLDSGDRVRVLGLYGLEDRSGPIPGSGEVPLEEVLPDAQRAAGMVPGASVEHKGRQVAVHYRGVRDPDAARRVLQERLTRIAERHGLRLLEGKMVLELAPGDAPNKGDAVERAVEGHDLGAVLYAGDDVADLDAFDAVDRLVSRGLDGVKVAVRSPEAPEELLSRADVVVESPSDLLGLLRELAEGA